MEGSEDWPKTLPKKDELTAEAKKQAELIEHALKTGRSTLFTWGIDDNQIAEGVYNEERDPRRVDPLKIDVRVADRVAFSGEDHRRLEDRMLDQGIYEITVIAPLMEDVKRTRIVKKPRKTLFGTKYDEVRETYVDHQRPITMSEIIGGANDPAAAIYYQARGKSYTEYQYPDGFGRPGNRLEVEIVVPLRLAQQISALAQKDPTLIRRLTEAFVQEYYSKKFKAATWEKFGRPPYSKWDSGPKSRMYFADLIAEPEAGGVPFDENAKKRVIEFTHTNLPLTIAKL